MTTRERQTPTRSAPVNVRRLIITDADHAPVPRRQNSAATLLPAVKHEVHGVYGGPSARPAPGVGPRPSVAPKTLRQATEPHRGGEYKRHPNDTQHKRHPPHGLDHPTSATLGYARTPPDLAGNTWCRRDRQVASALGRWPIRAPRGRSRRPTRAGAGRPSRLTRPDGPGHPGRGKVNARGSPCTDAARFGLSAARPPGEHAGCRRSRLPSDAREHARRLAGKQHLEVASGSAAVAFSPAIRIRISNASHAPPVPRGSTSRTVGRWPKRPCHRRPGRRRSSSSPTARWMGGWVVKICRLGRQAGNRPVVAALLLSPQQGSRRRRVYQRRRRGKVALLRIPVQGELRDAPPGRPAAVTQNQVGTISNGEPALTRRPPHRRPSARE